MVSQGQAVARLNSLAFAFLPLSYVATLFGMTNFSISSAWYPLGAFAIVVLVLLVFRLSSLSTKWRNNSLKQQLAEPKESRKRLTKPVPMSYQEQAPSTYITTPEGETQQLSATPPTPSPTSPKPSFLARVNPIRYIPWGRERELSLRLPRFSLPRRRTFLQKVEQPVDMGYLSVGAPSQPHFELEEGYRGWGSTMRRSDESLSRRPFSAYAPIASGSSSSGGRSGVRPSGIELSSRLTID